MFLPTSKNNVSLAIHVKITNTMSINRNNRIKPID